MLQDRQYMRRTTGPSWFSATVLLIILNVVAYVVEIVTTKVYGPNVHGLFALSLDGLKHGYIWQLLSFQFMHANELHLAFNCLGIYFFGRDVEQFLGRKSFWALYLTSGVAGGLVQVGLALLLGGRFEAPMVGASAGVFGFLAAFAMIFWDRQLTAFLFFLIPVNMRAKYLLVLSVIGAVVGMLLPGTVAHAAHLGGMVMGVIYMRLAIYGHWPKFGRAVRARPRQLVGVVTTTSKDWTGGMPPAAEDIPAEEFLSREVDPILDKISAHGIQSLTEQERRILEKARERMGRR
jgi:membrane associated rhomboid family serine protease